MAGRPGQSGEQAHGALASRPPPDKGGSRGVGGANHAKGSNFAAANPSCPPFIRGRKRRPWRVKGGGLIGLFLKQLLTLISFVLSWSNHERCPSTGSGRTGKGRRSARQGLAFQGWTYLSVGHGKREERRFQPAKPLAFPSPARRGRVPRQGRERASYRPAQPPRSPSGAK